MNVYGRIPYTETAIPAVDAKLWMMVEEERPARLEGLCFDRFDNLYCVDIDHDILYRINMKTKEKTVMLEAPGRFFASVKVHRDGRLFVCCLGYEYGVFWFDPKDGSSQPVKSLRGHSIDDLVFDRKGGFYCTELTGHYHNPTGGIYYVDASMESTAVVIPNLAGANGVALSTDEKTLWATEYNKGTLLRFGLSDDGLSAAQYESYCSYHFIGAPGPDSLTTDADDNVYVALNGQGRYMEFDRNGYPVRQIFLPGRAEGKNLCVTHCKHRPGTAELYMTGSSHGMGNGAGIFKAVLDSFAKENEFHLKK